MTALGDRHRAQGEHLSRTLLVSALQGDEQGVRLLTDMVVADEPVKHALANLAGLAAHLIKERAETQGNTTDDVVEHWRAELLAAQTA